MSQKMSFRSYSDSFQSRNPWKCELPHLWNPGNESENVIFAFFRHISRPGSAKNESRETGSATRFGPGPESDNYPVRACPRKEASVACADLPKRLFDAYRRRDEQGSARLRRRSSKTNGGSGIRSWRTNLQWIEEHRAKPEVAVREGRVIVR